jgi:predicted TIM-barrel fold metal-dependent hydrolase
MIIDSHVHLFSYENRVAAFTDALPTLLKEMSLNQIDYAIIIPDNVEGDPEIGDFAKVRELIKDHSNLYMLGSPQIVERGDSQVENFRNLAIDGVIKGIKLFPGHDPYYPTDERCFGYYDLCNEMNIPVVFHTGENSGDEECAKFNDPKYIVEIAQKYPQLKVVITHYFWPKLDYCYEITKHSPNIYFELAGTADKEVLDKSGGFEKMRQILIKTIDDRPNQVIYGTDWPMCNMEDHLDLVHSLNLPREIEEKIFSKNTIGLYQLPVKM